mmetsp:Transcript_22951/g.91820  ORF Transcript_22951/g.91820 Transcript_22951/m.91820 type:complete len:142 (+) Transcript_22951:66-491(+)
MTVHCFYLFNRDGVCLHYAEWNRGRKVKNFDEHCKLMFGMLFELKNFCTKLSPRDAANPPKYYVTPYYALHYFDTSTGLRFILLTTPDFGNSDVARVLRRLYGEVYLDYVAKNPLYEPGSQITNKAFSKKLDAVVRNLPCF